MSQMFTESVVKNVNTLFQYFERVCNFRRLQLSITVNTRHCMRMNNFLSEADLVSINI